MFFFIILYVVILLIFFFQAEGGIRDRNVTGVQTCALPIHRAARQGADRARGRRGDAAGVRRNGRGVRAGGGAHRRLVPGGRHTLAAAARRGDDPRVGREDWARRDRARGSAHRRVRRRARRARRREGAPPPPGAGAARYRLRRAVSVLAAGGPLRAVRRARGR